MNSCGYRPETVLPYVCVLWISEGGDDSNGRVEVCAGYRLMVPFSQYPHKLVPFMVLSLMPLRF